MNGSLKFTDNIEPGYSQSLSRWGWWKSWLIWNERGYRNLIMREGAGGHMIFSYRKYWLFCRVIVYGCKLQYFRVIFGGWEWSHSIRSENLNRYWCSAFFFLEFFGFFSIFTFWDEIVTIQYNCRIFHTFYPNTILKSIVSLSRSFSF